MTRMMVDWDGDVIRRYLTPESHQKSKEEFEKTHIDIDKIKAEYLFPHPTNDEFVTQEEFRDAIIKSNIKDDNRIFILRGETGSGKSQLCQWLEYQIGREPDAGIDETHIALHVSRSQTRIKDIIDILTEPVNLDIQVGNVEGLDPEKVADAMIANLDAYAPTAFEELSESEVESLIEDRPGTDLRSILKKNIRDYQEAVASNESNEIPDLIDEDDYRDLSFTAFGQARGGESIFPTLRGFLHDELSGKLNVGNFQEKLERISEAYENANLRPVLICEDLTTFSVLKEQLLDHIFQLDSGHYDVVLGWTTGWEKDDLDKALGTTENTYTYMKDRAEGYLSTTNENGQAYFLTEDVTVELGRKYISVIRQESTESVDIDIDEDAFEQVYPFNPEFIRRAYEHLVQDGNERRTPRLLLIRIIRECLTATAPPFESIDGNPYVKQFPTPVSIDLPAPVQDLAKWYGIPTAEQNIRIPAGIFEAFDVSVPDDVLESADPIVLQGKGNSPKRDFRFEQTAGTIEPGATVRLQATLNGRPEAEAEIKSNGNPIGFTDDEGKFDLELPDKEGEVTVTARKADLSDTRTFSVGTDSLNLTTNPSRPDKGEDVTVTARFNGEPVEGARIYKENQQVGTTNANGELMISADNPPEMTIRGEIDGIEDELTIQILGGGGYPVDVELSQDEVNQQRFEYEQWVKTGEEYNSSDTLRSGAVTALEAWHDPTRLANANAAATGVAGIYYARGSETPVSIQAVNERQGLSVELPFGTQHNDVYEPLLWCGLSEDDEFPQEDRYNLNYDLIRGWTDDKVEQFRKEMRSEIENCLPDGWTIEEFIIVVQYLFNNAADGTTELSRDLVFEGYDSSNGYEHPVGKRFSAGDSYRQAHSNLTKSSKALSQLAEGFFKLKENFVDYQRLNEAYEEVETNIDDYVTEAMYIDSDLPDAYKIGTNRSSASILLAPIFQRVKEYAQELDKLGSSDASHIVKEVDRIDDLFDESHNVPELLQTFESLYDAVSTLEVPLREKWEKQKERLEKGENIHLTAFQSDIESFRDVESKSGPELVAMLHRFEESRMNRVEWEIYDSLAEMIHEADGVEVPETSTELEKAVHDSEEMANVTKRCSSIESLIGGEY